ncbi:MAG: tetratricopeptide repeat protein [Taibaiella sp.]|nr:tetratricopeptide repeat protein [Taibaiella sp.]
MANSARTKPGEERITPEVNPLNTLQDRYEANKKQINTIVTVVLVVVLGYLAYSRLYKAPQEEKAATAISYPQRYMQYDSLNRALNGDGQHSGFLKIAKKYDGTKAANLCHYYAGVCYMHMGDFNNAIKQLKEFDGKGTLVQTAANGLLGDAYMESNNTKQGIEYYKKASEDRDNSLLTPTYLYRVGVAYELSGNTEEAKKAYKRIKTEYPQSYEARDIDKYLARLGELE